MISRYVITRIFMQFKNNCTCNSQKLHSYNFLTVTGTVNFTQMCVITYCNTNYSVAYDTAQRQLDE